jgi:GntR family transcriptional regulator, arabinose operon transcriptional repressor
VSPGQLLGSEHDMARETGLSRVSVRRAIGQLVGEGLLERRPGRGIYVRESHVATRMVQIIVPDLKWDRCIKTVQGIKSAANKSGAFCQIYDAHDNLDMDIEVIRKLPETNADGAIIIALHEPKFAQVMYELQVRNYPFVLVDQRIPDLEISSVVADNYGGGYTIGQELVKLGHRRIGYAGIKRPHTSRERVEGMRDAVLDAGLPFDRSLIMDIEDIEMVSDWRERLYKYTQRLLTRPDRPTAIFIMSDSPAMVSYRAIKDLGLRIPDDISVVGFDNDAAGQWVDPPLSTIDQQAEKIGKAALEILMKRIADPNATVVHRVIPTMWIPRGSIGPAKTMS